jgi:hypothetical protein
MHTAMEDALRTRFPNAELERCEKGLADVTDIVVGVIDDPTTDCDLTLDLRGTPYEVQVWLTLREIPVGQTTSYGALAAKLGSRDSRDATAAIANNPIAVIVPMPSRHQEGRLGLRLSVGCPSQARIARLRATSSRALTCRMYVSFRAARWTARPQRSRCQLVRAEILPSRWR